MATKEIIVCDFCGKECGDPHERYRIEGVTDACNSCSDLYIIAYEHAEANLVRKAEAAIRAKSPMHRASD